LLARNTVTLIVPLTIIVLSIPLILEKVPRNGLYGLRTAFTMSSDAVWYYANRVSGIALLLAGIVWLALSRILPSMMQDRRFAYRLVSLFGAASIVVGCAISYWLAYSRFKKRS
jgi:uncharacterized membrane protein